MEGQLKTRSVRRKEKKKIVVGKLKGSWKSKINVKSSSLGILGENPNRENAHIIVENT